MIDAKALPEFKKHIETLANQLSLFENKVKDASEIEPKDKGPEEEREWILSILASNQKKLPDIEKAPAAHRENHDRNDQGTPLPSPIERTIQIKTIKPIL